MVKLLITPFVLSGILVLTPFGVLSLDIFLIPLFIFLYLTMSGWRLPGQGIRSLLAVLGISFILVLCQVLTVDIFLIGNYSVAYFRFFIILILAHVLSVIMLADAYGAIIMVNRTLVVSSLFVIYDLFFPMFIEFGEYTYFSFSSFSRPRGLHAEPSFYVTFCVSLIIMRGILTVRLPPDHKVKMVKSDMITLLGFLVSLSLTGAIAAMFILQSHLRISGRKNAILYGFLLLGLSLALITLNFEYFFGRLGNIGADGSSVTRTIGGLLTGYYALINSPIFGFGLGAEQFQAASESAGTYFQFMPFALQSCNMNGTCSYEMVLSNNMFITSSYFSFGILAPVLIMITCYNLAKYVSLVSAGMLLFLLASRGDIYFLYFYLIFFLILRVSDGRKTRSVPISI